MELRGLPGCALLDGGGKSWSFRKLRLLGVHAACVSGSEVYRRDTQAIVMIEETRHLPI